jgi:hypothetical protein
MPNLFRNCDSICNYDALNVFFNRYRLLNIKFVFMRKIKLVSNKLPEIQAELLDDKNPITAQAIWDALPITVNLSTWGHELYGNIPVDIAPENSQEECEIGDIAYWLQGSCFCILYGLTPASTSNKPRLISAGNVFARIIGDASVFKKVDSLIITIDKV